MSKLKSTPEERTALRATGMCVPLLDDIDTLLAEREQLRGHVKALLGIGWLHRSCRGILGVLRGTHFNTKECNCKPGGIRKAAWAALETK